MLTTPKTILVLQPYLATYRLGFWHDVIDRLAAVGVTCRVAAGSPAGSQAARGDEVSIPGLLKAPMISLRLGGATVRTQRSWALWKECDGLVCEASGSLLDASLALLARKPVALWGHIDSFTNARSSLDQRIERWQLRRASSILAYTSAGARHAVDMAGVPEQKVTVLNNTISTAEMAELQETMTAPEADDILGGHGFDPGMTACYIGGLDASKRIDFLAEVLDQLQESLPRFRLFVGGGGDELPLLRAAMERGQVVHLSRVGVREKVALSLCSSAILMPGRVGLIAVDSFTLGLPIVTTNWPFHAPEFEYLSPGLDSLVSADTVDDYVRSVATLFTNPERLDKLREAARVKAGWPPLEGMVEAFCDGVTRLFRR